MFFQALNFPGGKVQVNGPLEAKNFPNGQLTLGSLLTKLLNTYLFPFAGLILLIIIIFGGFQLMTSSGDPEKVKAGQAKITAAFIGFALIFAAYWLMQLVETLIGFKLLG